MTGPNHGVQAAMDRFRKLSTPEMLASLGAYRIDSSGTDEEVREAAIEAKEDQLNYRETHRSRLAASEQPRTPDEAIARAGLMLRSTAELEASVGGYDTSAFAHLPEPERRAALIHIVLAQRAFGERKERERAEIAMIEVFELETRKPDMETDDAGEEGRQAESARLSHIKAEKPMPEGISGLGSLGGIFRQRTITNKYIYKNKKRIKTKGGSGENFQTVAKLLRNHVTKPDTKIEIHPGPLFSARPYPYKRTTPELQFALQSMAVLRGVAAGTSDAHQIFSTVAGAGVGCVRVRARGEAARALLTGGGRGTDKIIAKGFLRAVDHDLGGDWNAWSGRLRAAAVVTADDEDWRTNGAGSALVFLALAVESGGSHCIDAARFPGWFTPRLLGRLEEYFGSGPADLAFFEPNPAAFSVLAHQSGEVMGGYVTQSAKSAAKAVYERARATLAVRKTWAELRASFVALRWTEADLARQVLGAAEVDSVVEEGVAALSALMPDRRSGPLTSELLAAAKEGIDTIRARMQQRCSAALAAPMPKAASVGAS